MSCQRKCKAATAPPAFIREDVPLPMVAAGLCEEVLDDPAALCVVIERLAIDVVAQAHVVAG